MKKLFWKYKYARHLKRRLGLTMRECLQSAEAALENLNYDLDECPVTAAEEEYYCWQTDS